MRGYINKDCLELGCKEILLTQTPTALNQVEVIIIPMLEYLELQEACEKIKELCKEPILVNNKFLK